MPAGAPTAPRWKTMENLAAASAHPAPLSPDAARLPLSWDSAPSPGDAACTPGPTLLTLGEYLISPYSISYAGICRPSVFLSEVIS